MLESRMQGLEKTTVCELLPVEQWQQEQHDGVKMTRTTTRKAKKKKKKKKNGAATCSHNKVFNSKMNMVTTGPEQKRQLKVQPVLYGNFFWCLLYYMYTIVLYIATKHSHYWYIVYQWRSGYMYFPVWKWRFNPSIAYYSFSFSFLLSLFHFCLTKSPAPATPPNILRKFSGENTGTTNIIIFSECPACAIHVRIW